MVAPARPARGGVVAVGAVLLVVGLAACSGTEALGGAGAPASPQAQDPAVVQLQPGNPGEPNAIASDAPPEPVFAGSSFTDVDVAFMRDMQVHHEQALAMTAMVPQRSDHEDLQLFVRRLEASQTGELELLDRLLGEHEEAVRRGGGPAHDDGGNDGHGDGHDGGHSDGSEGADHSAMPGMASAADLTRLEAAAGEEFDRLFLVVMSRHHEGALEMVGDLFTHEDAAADPRLFRFAQHVDSDQRIEIDRMARMYAALPTG